MIDRDAIVAEARSMIGTPWHHQGRLPGVGLDCIGLVVCVLERLGYTAKDRYGYRRAPVPAEFIAAVREQAMEKPIDEMAKGDMLLIAPGKLLQHAAIYSGNDTIIHARTKAAVEEVTLGLLRTKVRHCFDLSSLNG